MKHHNVFGIIGLLWIFCISSLCAGVTVRNLTVQRHQPWNGFLDIIYSIECSGTHTDGSPLDIKVSFIGYDKDLDRDIVPISISGDGAYDTVHPGGPYKMTWNAAKDYPDFHSSAFSIKFTAEIQHTNAKYLVIDLSGGSTADSYPYRYSEADPDINSDVCRTTELWLRRIPAGTFMMGSPENEPGRDIDETPHQVTLTQPFYIGVFEITQSQWELVMGNNPSEYIELTSPVTNIDYGIIRGNRSNWPVYGHEVVAGSFMEILQAKTKLVFDLPTEAQWEYACRAGTTTPLNSGKQSISSDIMSEVGRWEGNKQNIPNGYSLFTRVGCFSPNSWGLYDMHGNVWELCLDWYTPNIGTEKVIDPVGPDDAVIYSQGTYPYHTSYYSRVWRGGGYNNTYNECRSAARKAVIDYHNNDIGNNDEGFRIIILPNEINQSIISYESLESVPEAGQYLVIDLSSGPEAPSYSYRYSETGPDISSNLCRTTELWLRQIPAGTFMMGSPRNEYQKDYDETQHQVTLTKSFFIGVFEITQEQWKLVMGNNPSEYQGDQRPVDNVPYKSIRGEGGLIGGNWPEYGHQVCVDSFMGRLQSKTGLVLDLPTEAQWEYACRAGTTTALNSGLVQRRQLSDRLWMDLLELGRFSRNCDDGRGGYTDHTTRVGSYKPNHWGLYDMHGNVWEWCLDWYDERLENQAAPDPVGPKEGDYRSCRGGSWFSEYCRSAERSHGQNCGLRVVLTPGEQVQIPLDTVQPAGRYLIINLKDGPDALSYPFRYSETGPDISSDECRTNELWLRELSAGTFTMTGKGEVKHLVTLTKPFFIGIFEVTQAQWQLVMGTNPSGYIGNNRPVEMVSYSDIRGKGEAGHPEWPQYGHKVGMNSFMGKIQAKTGLVFDLPTQAQWEYACRAGTNTALNSGKDLQSSDTSSPNLDELGRYTGNRNLSSEIYSDAHTCVGNYKPNAWGLYDMHGNVWEWCLDWGPEQETQWTSDPVGLKSASGRALCGGSWNCDAPNCQSGSCIYERYLSQGQRDYGFRPVFLPDISIDDLAQIEPAPEPAPEPIPDVPATGQYLVIELSTGTGKNSYHYRYSDIGPDLNKAKCRTEELWLRQIPAGTFIEGSPENERGRKNDETQHQYTIDEAFYMGVFEVTQEQWTLVMGNNPSKHIGPVRPVENITTSELGESNSYAAANSNTFLSRLSSRTGLKFGLPTSLEWEYACRAETNTALNSGKNLSSSDGICVNLNELGRYIRNKNDQRGGYSDAHTKVGSYRPNYWGLYDMHGNVKEFILQIEHRHDSSGYYPGYPTITPPPPPLVAYWGKRGGSWKEEACDCRSASDRQANMTYIGEEDDCGLRLICTP